MSGRATPQVGDDSGPGRRAAAAELGAFLRSRRAAVTPAQVGIEPSYGALRRVPGLRRDELALLIGVSTTYYTRLEQGEAHQVSDAILSSLADKLSLSPDERAHLYRLARNLPPARASGHEDEVRPPILELISSNHNPVVLVGRRTDILAGNALGLALWQLDAGEVAAIGSADPPNQARRMFLQPAMRTLFADWRQQAVELTAYLRLASAERPDDLDLHRLIAELTTASDEFAAIWHDRPVQDCLHTPRRYRHPLVGELTLNEEILRLPDDPGQRLIISAAEPGSADADKLELLGALSSS